MQEVNEWNADSSQELILRLENRFHTISSVTKNNYLYHDLSTNDVSKLIEEPSVVFDTINDVPFAQSAMKQLANMISEKQKEDFRQKLNIDSKELNNYTSAEVISHLSTKNDLMEGYSFLETIERAMELHPNGHEMGLHNRIAGIFEMLDLIGYWKDKYSSKSNYARLWDSSHAYFSSFCDYFISDDKRTRKKAKIVFDIYRIPTKIRSSKGEV